MVNEHALPRTNTNDIAPNDQTRLYHGIPPSLTIVLYRFPIKIIAVTAQDNNFST